jgi:hypothetical protein
LKSHASWPTEDSPEEGCVCFFGIALSHGYRFVDEHGTHVIRSDEFDVYGEGDSLKDAIADFVFHARDLHKHLIVVAESDDVTENELRVASLLGQRLLDVYERASEIVDRGGLLKMLELRLPVFDFTQNTVHCGCLDSKKDPA